VYPRFKYAEVDKIPGPPKHWLNGTIIRAPPGRGNLDQHLKNSLTYGGIARYVPSSSSCSTHSRTTLPLISRRSLA